MFLKGNALTLATARKITRALWLRNYNAAKANLDEDALTDMEQFKQLIDINAVDEILHTIILKALETGKDPARVGTYQYFAGLADALTKAGIKREDLMQVHEAETRIQYEEEKATDVNVNVSEERSEEEDVRSKGCCGCVCS